MDSEDEREIMRKDINSKSWHSLGMRLPMLSNNSFVQSRMPSCAAVEQEISLRLYANEEARARAWASLRHFEQLSSYTAGVLASTSPRFDGETNSVPCFADCFRVQRFFDTFVGFHKVRPQPTTHCSPRLTLCLG